MARRIWDGTDATALRELGLNGRSGAQLVLRAIVFRSVAGLLLGGEDGQLFERAADIALAAATRTR